ncbi:MAG: alpha-amylase family glycosyl hydrolase [Bacteroidetes bacterium]|nr:alpha-amylase family glycosyl hydrolase [Bacteroidota bacterium]
MTIQKQSQTKITLKNVEFSFGVQSPKFEFHIAGNVRKKYEVDEELFSINGNIVLANFKSVRRFVQKLNAKREAKERVTNGQVNAAGLIDEIYHFLFRLYETHVNPGVFEKAINHLNQSVGEENTRKVLFEFVSLFPSTEVFKGHVSTFDYLNSFTADRSNTQITVEELILLHIANFNPANKKLIELFDENYFSEKELYKRVLVELDLFFQSEKKFGPYNQDIFSLFKTPILTHPESIEAQLDFIREKFGILLDEKFLKRLLSSKDLMKEDSVFEGTGGGGAPTIAPQYKGGFGDADFLMLGKSGYKYALDSTRDYDEPERFTQDTDWMPRVVVLAKNTYVWLDQLSKKYGRHIRTLDQIPDEELDQLARWNFNGLWLIGIWERSSASKRIKHIMGNIDAVSSAYSLYDYQIAWDLGGEDAYNNLNARAQARGIRLASDMVPNHTGIFSKWVVEHPEYFIQSPYPPFPNYSFTGPNLSEDPSVQLRIEDGYWSRSDAAVVFQRIDNRTGEHRYIYHGNDGTNMPWNDTAQLNMIRQDVREAVIQKIFDVARKFSIIRFDAAMTLTKRHFSRLWYPEPGRGGDIPSRSDYAMTREEFDRVFPEEFWREVVDRINSEMPNTLLLAEAFWLMEGYFVRSLGMHRVYNSAFMHMMMKEENAKYRDLISNTLEFEPEILKRYVNFMSNPDEETAIKQFGTEDKYFGVCTLMVTLPGLPMFAHGQIEGYTEKYGMEYQRAYYHETPNQWLIDRHAREIFPLMKKRYLFSQVNNFWLFDFYDGYGNLNENVYAYTNSEHGERALIFFNNKYEQTTGNIFHSSQKLIGSNNDKRIETRTIAEALGVNPSSKHYYIFREHISNLEYLRSGSDIARNGFFIELGAFKYLVYLDWREVYDSDGTWKKLSEKLSGGGTANMERARQEMLLEPIHSAFEKMFDEESLDGFIKTCIVEETEKSKKDQIKFIEKKYSKLLKAVVKHFDLKAEIEPVIELFEEQIVSVRKLNRLIDDNYDLEKNPAFVAVHKAIRVSRDTNYHENSIIFMLWLIISTMKGLFAKKGSVNQQNYVEALLFDTPVKKILQKFGRSDHDIYRSISLLNIFQQQPSEIPDVFKKENKVLSPVDQSDCPQNSFLSMLNDKNVHKYLGVNQYENVLYFSKENFEELLEWLFTLSGLSLMKAEGKPKKKKDYFEEKTKEFDQSYLCFKKLVDVSKQSGYKIERLKDLLDVGKDTYK